MIFGRPATEDAIDQGDIIDGCPVLQIRSFDIESPSALETGHALHRVVVLSQTCDLANRKLTEALVAIIHDAQGLVDQGVLKRADVRGPVRAGRVWGWYFLPKSEELALPEAIVDFWRLHTIRLDILTALCLRGQRRARIQPLYREHLAKHFADTYSRIGLPEAYETE